MSGGVAHPRRRVHRLAARGRGRSGPDHPGGDRRGRRVWPRPALLAPVLRRGRSRPACRRGRARPRLLLRHHLRRHAEDRARQHRRRLQARRDPGIGLDGRADHGLQRPGRRPDRHAAADQVDRALCADGRPRHPSRPGQGQLPGPRLRRQCRPPRADRPGAAEGQDQRRGRRRDPDQALPRVPDHQCPGGAGLCRLRLRVPGAGDASSRPRRRRDRS